MKKLNQYLSQFDVSRETLDKLKTYEALLYKWQKAINLVSNATIKDAEIRHFLDSAQLYDYLNNDVQSVVDIGSGAGFPALVLAILRPDIEFSVIESDQRKCTFMATVSRETSMNNLTIHNERIENVEGLNADVVSARALKDLNTLFGFATMFEPKFCLFPKGQNYAQEVAQAKENGWSFDFEEKQSITDENAKILKITNLVKTQ
ncbi:MAG: 16S rRNA (guanine(527)-N(7))-methyltransferase RsmG [Rickettsiales bacterium]|nr:16S rRNA (guanine(527)-N(7))-methyltransferase RsmG [Rickettsiales bacterium]|tara:strand:- start:959 stop:1573 length:615 start_codon:yes stop_codon:yes gene_type:complete